MTPSEHIVPESAEDTLARRGLFVAASAAGFAYAAALAYPIYRYLASPIEQAAAMAAVSEVSLKDAHKLARGSVLMFKFGSQPAMLIHHRSAASSITLTTYFFSGFGAMAETVNSVRPRQILHRRSADVGASLRVILAARAAKVRTDGSESHPLTSSGLARVRV